MLPLLSLHAIATQRGDGLHPVLLAGLKRLAAARIEHVVAESGRREHEERAAEQQQIAFRARKSRSRSVPPDSLTHLKFPDSNA
jgi:hypothetical protein